MTYGAFAARILRAVITPKVFRDWVAAEVKAHGGVTAAQDYLGLSQSHLSQIVSKDTYEPGLEKLGAIADAKDLPDLSALFRQIEAWHTNVTLSVTGKGDKQSAPPVGGGRAHEPHPISQATIDILEIAGQALLHRSSELAEQRARDEADRSHRAVPPSRGKIAKSRKRGA